MNFNKAIIAGNLTRDPESRTLPSGQSVVNFGVASNRRFTDKEGNRQETTEFHNIVAFGRWADICSQYLKKGMPVLVEGRLQTNSWQGQDGVKRSRTEIIMEFMQMGPRLAGSGPTAPQKPGETTSQEEIPVIEAEEPIKAEESQDKNSESPAQGESTPGGKEIENKEKEEVDVKDIPF
jgi:single-strand DNA-binding protein